MFNSFEGVQANYRHPGPWRVLGESQIGPILAPNPHASLANPAKPGQTGQTRWQTGPIGRVPGGFIYGHIWPICSPYMAIYGHMWPHKACTPVLVEKSRPGAPPYFFFIDVCDILPPDPRAAHPIAHIDEKIKYGCSPWPYMAKP